MTKRILGLASLIVVASTNQVFAADATPNATHASSYVKLLVSKGAQGGAICGGVLITSDMVLTASHCVPDSWAQASDKKVTFSYGKQFATKANLRAGKSWVKFDPTVDLAIIRMDRQITTASGATVATLDQACTTKPSYSYPKKSIFYHHMGASASTYKTTTSNISNYKKSPLANGQSYETSGIGVPGDSGSPLFSTDKILIGIYNGNSGKNSFFASLCLYRGKINASMKELAVLK